MILFGIILYTVAVFGAGYCLGNAASVDKQIREKLNKLKQ